MPSTFLPSKTGLTSPTNTVVLVRLRPAAPSLHPAKRRDMMIMLHDNLTCSSRHSPWTHLLCKLYEIVYLCITSRAGTPELSYQWLENIAALQAADNCSR